MMQDEKNKRCSSRKKKFVQTIKDYKDPDAFLSAAFEYFAWCEDNPWTKKELQRSGERKGEIVEIPVTRPYTLAGLCVYCNINESIFRTYLKSDDMKGAAQHILDTICQNQTEGAIIGAYNSSFVSRLLELNSISNDQENRLDVPFMVTVADSKTKDELEKFRDKLRLG